MKLKTFTIKLMSIATAAATAFAVTASLPLTPTASAADTEGTTDTQSTLPTSLQNGDFESPGIQEILDNAYFSSSNDSTYGTYKGYTISNNVEYTNWYGTKLYPEIITYSKGNAWFVTSKDIFDDISDNKFYWETTDYNQRVELALGTQGMGEYFPSTNNPPIKNGASSGTQFAELVPEKKSSLYQSISTEPGKVLSWSLDHRARRDDTDIMAIFIGPKQDYLQKTSDDANDIFMEMAELIENQFNEIPVGKQIGPIKLYSKKVNYENRNISDTSVSTSNYGDYTEEWHCWIVKSNANQWYNYSGIYTVPEGQTETTLAFTAMTSGNAGASTEEGNCLDNIRLGELFPLTLTATPGGTGSMEPNDKGSAAVKVDGDETDGTPSSKRQLYEKGENVTITATPTENYIFTGAIINGQNIGISNDQSSDGFKQDNDGTYTCEVTMDQTYNVVLIFALKGYITYDANGGTIDINGSKSTYTHEFTQIGETLKNVPAPVSDKKQFLGWRLFANTETGEQTAITDQLIPEGHSVTYNTNNGTDPTITISWDNNQQITLPASKEDAVFMLAIYSQNLSVEPMTRYVCCDII